MKNFAFLLFLLMGTAATAQYGYYRDYNWESVPAGFTVSDEELLEDEIVLFEKRSIEVVSAGEKFVQLMLVHTITLLNTDAAIEKNNKMYVASGPESRVIRQQARVIRPDGQIIVLNEKDIKESTNEEGEVEYRYFALDGIEKGCRIEYLHYIERAPVFTGSSLYLQGSVKKKDVEIDIISPTHLEYEIYPVNGMPDFLKDSTAVFVRRMVVHAYDLPGLEEEPWSDYNAALQKCYYKIKRNTQTGMSNFYNYSEATKIVHGYMYEPASKKAQKAMQTFIRASDPGSGASLEDRIRALEYKLKSEIGVMDFDFEGSLDVATVLSKKITSTQGMTKLMVQLLREMDVKHELVLTSDKTENPFLQEFEGYNFLEEHLIYVNELDMYLSPSLISRLGFPPFVYTNTKGLFIREVGVNDIVTAVGKIKPIKGTRGDQSVDEINTVVTFGDDDGQCTIGVERIASGYKAEYPQAILNLLNDERKQEALEDFLLYVDEDAKLENVAFENDNSAVTGVKPLIGRATFNGANFIEKAGDKTLLKAGLLIGPQAELYNEEKRTLPVEAAYTRQYKRRIEINIPEGQTVRNPEAVVFDVTPDKENNSTGFVSSYEIVGNKLIVTIFEYYNRTSFTTEEYPMYESVMNAAADFNKVVLIFDRI